jgi:hypothetical protein
MKGLLAFHGDDRHLQKPSIAALRGHRRRGPRGGLPPRGGERVGEFLDRPIEGDWPYLCIDATYVKVRQNGRIVSVAVIIAVGVNSDGRRELLGMAIGASEAETFWTEFLRQLARRGLRGVKLVISDAHEGIKAAVAKVFTATWQRCRVHFMRNVLAHAGKSGRRVVSAFIGTAFAQNDAGAASQPFAASWLRRLRRSDERPPGLSWRRIADQLRPKVPKLAKLPPGPAGPVSSRDRMNGLLAIHGQRRARRPGRHDLPGPTPHQAALHKPDRAPQPRDQTPHPSAASGPRLLRRSDQRPPGI